MIVATQRRYETAQAGGNVIAGDLTILTEGDLINRGGTFWGDDGVTLMAGRRYPLPRPSASPTTSSPPSIAATSPAPVP